MCATWAGLGTYGSNGLLSLLALVVVPSPTVVGWSRRVIRSRVIMTVMAHADRLWD